VRVALPNGNVASYLSIVDANGTGAGRCWHFCSLASCLANIRAVTLGVLFKTSMCFCRPSGAVTVRMPSATDQL